jgi:hypothetical protein
MKMTTEKKGTPKIPPRDAVDARAASLGCEIEWHDEFPTFGWLVMPNGKRRPVSRANTIECWLLEIA